MRAVTWCLAVALLASPSCAWQAPTERAELELRWAQDVLLGAEIGRARDIVVRWPADVRVLAVGFRGRSRSALDAAAAELRDALGSRAELQLEHVAADDPRIGRDGYVTAFAKAPRNATELARRYGAHAPDSEADGWFTIRWNDRHELVRGILFVAPRLSDRWLRHTALEELFQCLGPSNDSDLLVESVVFEGRHGNGSRQRLSRVDRELLRLLYGALRPGDRAVDIRRAMRRGWDFGR